MSIAENYERVLESLSRAAEKSARSPKEINLIAVSKTHSADHIQEIAALGQKAFGENRVAELADKNAALAALNLEWHLIGQLQTNKVKLLPNGVIMHSLDRISLADALAKRNEKMQALIQVNCSGEAAKSGVALGEFEALVEHIAKRPQIEILGLMTIAENSEDPRRVRQAFQKLRELSDWLARQKIFAAYKGWLSMGMSGDFALAIAEGATHVRIGSAIFGSRN